MTSIEIPSSVNSIGASAFQGCTSLTSIEIPSSVTSIGGSAFQGCKSLTSIEIPSSITSIGGSAFAGCTSLTSIICYAENIPSTGSDIFSECPASMIINVYANSLDLYKTSSQWNDFTIEPIAYIVDYGDYSLKYAIESASDKECEVLLGATSGSRLVISIPSTVEINQNTYDVTSVGDNAFRDCSSLYAIDVPSCITSIGDEAFRNSSLKLISFGENSQLTYIGKRAFQNSGLFKIKIPSGVISIEEYTFLYCSSLSSVTFCENSQLRSIGYSAFECNPKYANHLKSIEIPSSVTSIGNDAFSGCKSLTKIICYAENVPTAREDALEGCPSGMVIYVPKNSFEMYKTTLPWSNYTIKSMPTHCEVVLVVNPSQAGTVIGAGSYDINDDVTIIATVNEGYTFVNWTENGKVVSEEAEYKFTTTIYEENREFVANFEPMDYEVTASVNNENFGTVTGSGNYKHGDNVKLTAVSNAGYAFVNWTENGEVVSEEAEYSFIIKSDRNLVANFIEAYDVEVSLNPENAGSVTGTGIYKQGDNVTLIASQKEGYKFINWTENGEVVSEEAEYSFTITSDRDLVANFELLTYEVTASVNNENFGTVTGSGNYKHGDNVKLTAVSNAGYAFVNWTENGEVVSEEAEYSFIIKSDRNLVANFIEAYDVEVSLNPENAGSVTGTGIYKQGDNVTLIASQKEGYKFINWTENGEVVSEEAEYSFTITSDRDLVANFELLTYEVTASVNNENFGTVTGSGNYKHGDNVKLTAVSKAGYAFVNWTENGEVVSEEAEYSFTITTDRDLVANFVSTESISEMSSSMNIYPNPVNDKLYIETEVEVEKLVVYDIYGRHQVAETPSRQGDLTIDLSNLTSGVYFVKIVTDNGNVVKRIVKN